MACGARRCMATCMRRTPPGAARAHSVHLPNSELPAPVYKDALSQLSNLWGNVKAWHDDVPAAEAAMLDERIQHFAIHSRLLQRDCTRLSGPLTPQRAGSLMAGTVLVLLRIALPVWARWLAGGVSAVRAAAATDTRLHITMVRDDDGSSLAVSFDVPMLSVEDPDLDGAKVARLLALAVRVCPRLRARRSLASLDALALCCQWQHGIVQLRWRAVCCLLAKQSLVTDTCRDVVGVTTFDLWLRSV